MAVTTGTIQKEPRREPDQEFTALRRKGIELIERMSSRWWTDYNSHDPGVTMLEALCYAITDLGYRIGWDIADLLQNPPGDGSGDSIQPFFTAREILTVNPLTADDFRRLLIDHEGIGKAWIANSQTDCESAWYADCKHDRLSFMPTGAQTFERNAISPRGIRDVFVQFENDPELGDLNDRKIRHAFAIQPSEGKALEVTAEFRMPAWSTKAWGETSVYVNDGGKLKGSVTGVTLNNIVESERKLSYLADLKILFTPDPVDKDESDSGDDAEVATVITLDLPAVPVRLYGSTSELKSYGDTWSFSDFDSAELARAVAEPFLLKSAAVQRITGEATSLLRARRNLCEEFCRIEPVQTEEVAICAEILVTAEADIEQVFASMVFAIENCFNPPLAFHSLDELLREGMAVEEIFEGPMLKHGFLKQEELDNARLRKSLRTSDIINEIVEIEGVVAVRNLRLTRYDSAGNPASGVADIAPGVDKKKISAEWTLEISENCLPILSIDNSAFLFFKNDLPFVADFAEVRDTLEQLRGEAERLKARHSGSLDLPVPAGRYRDPEQYTPVQYSLPATYGTGPDGVREPATAERRAQVKQLKGYLMVFEQLLANTFSQLAGARHLFSLDPEMQQTMFVQSLNDENLILGVTEILKAELDEAALHGMVETTATMQERRGRFLDHLLARFGEQFSDYALRLTGYDGKKKPAETLIEDKLAFLSALPELSRDRAKGLNTAATALTPEDEAVLKKRISLLAGLAPETAEKIIVVEHLLLRPRFPGDALMEACLDEQPCGACGEADPYSFQLTVVMPGWLAPFDKNIELRRFVENTIRQELPCHILGKICWVDNHDYDAAYREKLTVPLADYLREEGRNAGNARPSVGNAQKGANNLHDAALESFSAWMKSEQYRTTPDDKRQTTLRDLFVAELDPLSNIYSGVSNYDVISPTIYDMMSEHFAEVVEDDRWYIYKRFKDAWDAWLAALPERQRREWKPAGFVSRVQALMTGMIGSWLDPAQTARQALEQFGDLFDRAMRELAAAGDAVDDPKEVVAIILDCALRYPPFNSRSLSADEKEALQRLFIELYAPRLHDSLLLREVVTMHARLTSIYPPATLHDCVDGNDVNPVRLDSTILGA
ncbi:hypothetical protein BIU88_06700 [Chlorobaculum limnaeum]|uniref:Uncharacterized protein n=1 Tax=Chlorobaculum limnaeum TaxID=274537 RepID=A0A1D8D430_CHLLM|nr:hypothetical protein [Chlorobaculum limnaeum]AOS83867.1 hypothetical protein BIU88_06700 [Chlorobaculum limnaeum]